MFKLKPNHKEDFLIKAIKAHGSRYNYSKVIYGGSWDKITIICPEHGEFQQSPRSHIRGSGCQICAKCKKLSTESFILKADSIHNNKFDYSKVEYKNSRSKVCIICPMHGEFWQIANLHLQGRGCASCNESKSEAVIENFLKENNIGFVREKRFDDCRNKETGYILPFDFYLPSHNLLIEYDGEQHFLPLTYRGCKTTEEAEERLLTVKKRDRVKDLYCKSKDISLLRIPYWKKSNIEEILGGRLLSLMK